MRWFKNQSVVCKLIILDVLLVIPTGLCINFSSPTRDEHPVTVATSTPALINTPGPTSIPMPPPTSTPLPTGPPIGIYHDHEFRERDVDVEVAVPVAGSVPEGDRVKERRQVYA